MAVTLNASTSSGFIASSDTSGSLELQANGTTKATVGSTGLSIGQYNPAASLITRGTAVNSTSGTSIDFTGIPSWVRRITVMFNGVSTSGTSNPLIQLGDSGGIENTGYNTNSLLLSINAVETSTSGFIFLSSSAASIITGQIIFSLFNASNTWVGTGIFSYNQSGFDYQLLNNGVKTLSATLDRVRITTVNGTDTFDAGSINILYE